MSDYTPIEFKLNDIPCGDTMQCPCCGEELPNLLLINAIESQLDHLDDRVNTLSNMLRSKFPECTEHQVSLYAPMIVAISMYIETLPAKMIEDVRHELQQLELPISYVYFIQGVDGGPIKIGRSCNPERRKKDLKTSQPLKILATFMGGRQKENELHRRFSQFRLHGEWFEPADEILEYIRGINGNSGTD